MCRKTLIPFVLSLLAVVSASSQTPAQNGTENVQLTRVENHLKRGRLALAEQALFAYIMKHPKDAKAYILLGDVRSLQGRSREALSLYRKTLSIRPSFLPVKVKIARAMLRAGETAGLPDLVGELKDNQFADPEIQLELARVLLDTGNPDDSLRAAMKLPTEYRNGEALPVFAEIYLRLKEGDRLFTLVSAIKRQARRNPDVVSRSAASLRKGGFAEEASAVLELALRYSPDHLDSIVLLAEVRMDADDGKAAAGLLRKAEALKKRTLGFLTASARYESMSNRYDKALPYLQEASALSPDSPAILKQTALTALRAGKASTALSFSSRLRKVAPGDDQALYLYGAALYQSGSPDLAVSALEEYTRKQPGDIRGCLTLGLAYDTMPDKDAAKRQFTDCLKLDGENVQANLQLGLIYQAEGDAKPAIRHLEAAIRREPKQFQAILALGKLYAQTSDDDRARELFERAAALRPENEEAHFQLARIYNRLGKKGLAKKHMELFRRLKEHPAGDKKN